jgi:hypothetical protein
MISLKHYLELADQWFFLSTQASSETEARALRQIAYSWIGLANQIEQRNGIQNWSAASADMALSAIGPQ